MIYRMIAKDLLRFFVIYLIFIMGYSQAYYIIFQTYNGKIFHQKCLAKTKVWNVLIFPDNKCKRLSSGSGNCLQFMPHNAPFESFFRVCRPKENHTMAVQFPCIVQLLQMFDMSLGHFAKLYRLLPYCKLPLHIIGKVAKTRINTKRT